MGRGEGAHEGGTAQGEGRERAARTIQGSRMEVKVREREVVGGPGLWEGGETVRMGGVSERATGELSRWPARSQAQKSPSDAIQPGRERQQGDAGGIASTERVGQEAGRDGRRMGGEGGGGVPTWVASQMVSRDMKCELTWPSR